jgi:hypothetical protein
MWREQMLFNLLSDYEILRFRVVLVLDYLSRGRFRKSRCFFFRPVPCRTLENNKLQGLMGVLSRVWKYIQKHGFQEQIQENIEPSS